MAWEQGNGLNIVRGISWLPCVQQKSLQASESEKLALVPDTENVGKLAAETWEREPEHRKIIREVSKPHTGKSQRWKVSGAQFWSTRSIWSMAKEPSKCLSGSEP